MPCHGGAKVRLTDLTIRNLKPRGARRQVQDADILGFRVLVTATADTKRSELLQGAHIPGGLLPFWRLILRTPFPIQATPQASVPE
jgi:hypothetical protein